MSGTMMHHGARVPVEVLKFNSLVLFSSEKSFTLSLPIQIGNELERGLVFLSEVSCKILLEPLSLVLQPKEKTTRNRNLSYHNWIKS